MVEARILIAKAIKRSYTCCIYLSDNVCDPIDSECIDEYNFRNNRFHVFAFAGFVFVLFLIFIVSTVCSCLQRRRDKNEAQHNPFQRSSLVQPKNVINKRVKSSSLSEEDVEETASKKPLKKIGEKPI